MIQAIKAEFRKLFSVRSTYILMGLALLYMIFYDFYIVGFRHGMHTEIINGLSNPHYLMTEVTRAGGIAAPILFSAIIAVLLMAHEYRYNTIMYTLTASNSRNKTLLSKVIAVTGFSILFALVVELLTPTLALLGLHFDHAKLVHQTFYYHQFITRVLFYSWAYSMIALVLVLFLRNIVACVVALFLLPVTIEPLIGLLLNSNQQQYLPFTALTAVLNNGLLLKGPNLISAGHSAIVVIIYLVVSWAIAWYLFLRRDAN